MRASQIAARAALACSAAGIICAVWSAVDDTAAHAADHDPGLLPAAVDLADTPARTVEQTPRHVTKLTEAAPTPVRKATEPVEPILDTVVDTVQPPTKTPPPPAAQPKPLPAPATQRATEAVPAVVLLAGPAPSTVTLDPTQADSIAPAAAQALRCGDDTGEANPRPERMPAPSAAPCTPDGRGTTTGLTQPPTKTGVDQLAATTPSGPATPALLLLGELLPRSDVPTGRTTPPEPGPA